MPSSKLISTLLGLPKLLIVQALKPLRVAMRKPVAAPKTQQQLADLVNASLAHQIRAGYTHRFIDLMFVTVGERVFCRRYTHGEPSWHSVFLSNPGGQVKLDKTIINIEANVPLDMAEITPTIDQSYAESLKKLGTNFMLKGATEPRTQQSTLEITLSKEPLTNHENHENHEKRKHLRTERLDSRSRR